MKVLIFMTQFYQLSGAERLAVELAEELNKRGIHADILSMYTEDLPGVAKARAVLLKKGIPAVRFLGMKIHPLIVSMIPAILKLRSLIREEGYDVVETSMMSPSVLACWATLGLQTKHVMGLHDVFRKDQHNGIRHKVWRFSVRCNRRTRFYAISDYVSKYWINYSNTDSELTQTIYNGIPKDCFEAVPDRNNVRRELGISPSTRIVLFVGRMLKRKGIDTAFEAVGPLLLDYDLCLVYIGGWDQPPEGFFPGEDGLLDRMKDRISRECCMDRIRFLGRRNDVPRMMASSDILVHPAWIEGFGLVLVEAMAAGLPVVASNVQGIPEVLEGTDSIMVPPDDPEAFREAVITTLNRTTGEASQAIEKGRERAEAFRICKRIDTMVGLFENVIAGRF